MEQTFVATMPGRFELPTTVQAHDDGQIIGELNDDQLTLDEIEAEKRAIREMRRSFDDAANERERQLHLLFLDRLGLRPLGFGPVPGVGKFIEVAK
jgi:hypothetical protein